MTVLSTRGTALVRRPEAGTPLRIAESALSVDSTVASLDDFLTWFADYGRRAYTDVERIPLADLQGWSSDPATGNLHHHTGKFFSIEGLDVHVDGAAVTDWSQPIINQPEVGILGILMKEFNGVLHCLMQAKVEPGNRNGLQLSPTVQATRSNYTGVHRGRSVPYLEHFRATSRHHVLADVRQSEQGSWFHQKRNRNMIVEITEDVEVLDGFAWLTVAQVHQLLALDDVVNMDARTVLSCMPFAGLDLTRPFAPRGSGFGSSLLRSCSDLAGARHGSEEILSWITDTRTRNELTATRIPLNQITGWHHDDGRIVHHSGRFFDVMGVHVTARGREISSWTQPMIQPHGTGIIAFLVRDIGGVLHALVHARVEPGYLDVVELGPTVQCTPENYAVLPPEARPPLLDELLRAPQESIRYESIMSEEGGRFYHAQNRYLIVDSPLDESFDHPDFRWMALHQLVDLLRHSNYLNVQARSLVACLHSLFAGAATNPTTPF